MRNMRRKNRMKNGGGQPLAAILLSGTAATGEDVSQQKWEIWEHEHLRSETKADKKVTDRTRKKPEEGYNRRRENEKSSRALRRKLRPEKRREEKPGRNTKNRL